MKFLLIIVLRTFSLQLVFDLNSFRLQKYPKPHNEKQYKADNCENSNDNNENDGIGAEDLAQHQRNDQAGSSGKEGKHGAYSVGQPEIVLGEGEQSWPNGGKAIT